MTDFSLIPSGVAIVFLLLGAVYCSASETAVLASSKVRLHHLAKKGNHRAQIILDLQARVGSFVGTILLGNTLCITLATTLSASIATDLFGTFGVLAVGLVMSGIITIYAEVAPKIFVYVNPERVSLALAPTFRPILWTLSPLTYVIEWIAKRSLQMVGVETNTEILDSSTEELLGAIDLHKQGGAEEAFHERAMLRSILELTEVSVTEIMTHRKKMFMLDASMPNKKIIDKVLKSPYTRVPLWKDNPDNIVGILHAKHLLRAVRAHDGDANQLDIEAIATKPWFAPESTTLFAQLQQFRERHEHVALVVDEYGGLLGLVTLEDVLEEIVGEIVDEHDVELSGVRTASDGSYVIEGWVTLRDLNRQFEWELPDDDASTLAGLILHETRKIPEVGQSFIFHGFRFDILKKQRQQITQVRVTPPL